VRLRYDCLYTYELKEERDGLTFKDFGDDLDTWIDFVCRCRDGEQGYREFDVIVDRLLKFCASEEVDA